MTRCGSEVSLCRIFRQMKHDRRYTSVAVRTNGAAHYVGQRGRRAYLKRLMPMKPATVPTPFRKVK